MTTLLVFSHLAALLAQQPEGVVAESHFRTAFQTAVEIADERLRAEQIGTPLEACVDYYHLEPEAIVLSRIVTKETMRVIDEQLENRGYESLEHRIALLTLAKLPDFTLAATKLRQFLVGQDRMLAHQALVAASYFPKHDRVIAFANSIVQHDSKTIDATMLRATVELLAAIGNEESLDILRGAAAENERAADLYADAIANIEERELLDSDTARLYARLDALLFWQSSQEMPVLRLQIQRYIVAAERLQGRVDRRSKIPIAISRGFLERKLPNHLAMAILAVQRGEAVRPLLERYANDEGDRTQTPIIAKDLLKYLDDRKGD